MANFELDVENQRVMTKVARLYHSRGIRQTEIASRLGISQARVSRLLRAAEEAEIVRTVVVIPDGLYAELEEALELRYGLDQVHVVDTVDDDESELTKDLGQAAATVLQALPGESATIGFTSWSRSLRQMALAMRPVRHPGNITVVEMLGDVGPPRLPAFAHEPRQDEQLADIRRRRRSTDGAPRSRTHRDEIPLLAADRAALEVEPEAKLGEQQQLIAHQCRPPPARRRRRLDRP